MTTTPALDPRLRRAAALLLGAMFLPVELSSWAKQAMEAAKVHGGNPTVNVMLTDDPEGAIREAIRLAEEVLAEKSGLA